MRSLVKSDKVSVYAGKLPEAETSTNTNNTGSLSYSYKDPDRDLRYLTLYLTGTGLWSSRGPEKSVFKDATGHTQELTLLSLIRVCAFTVGSPKPQPAPEVPPV